MSLIQDIEALRHLREPSYSKRITRIVNNCRDLNDTILSQRIELKRAEYIRIQQLNFIQILCHKLIEHVEIQK